MLDKFELIASGCDVMIEPISQRDKKIRAGIIDGQSRFMFIQYSNSCLNLLNKALKR